MKIVIGFSRAIAWWAVGSLLIQLAEKRPFSHAYIRYNDALANTEIVTQASHGFVNEWAFEAFKAHNTIVEEYALECSCEQFQALYAFSRKNLGTPYSRTQLFVLAIKKLFHRDVKYTNKDQAFICSEWASRLCEIVGKDLPEDLDTITPSDFNSIVKSWNLEVVT